MKVSLAWIFDHINADWRQCDVPRLVTLFNKTTAEFEAVHRLALSFDSFCVACVSAVTADSVMLESLEWNTQVTLPGRSDAVKDFWYVIKKHENQYQWASLHDFGATKDGLMPAITCPPEWQNGAWKKHIQADDYILELNNSSVTHRPDLWGMRGLARECAAILGLPLKPIDDLAVPLPVEAADSASTVDGLMVQNRAPHACDRFAAWLLPSAQYQPSSLLLAARLCRVDYRPINVFVDATNYVMIDLGQPLHAFDADKLSALHLEPCMARAGQKLMLLDGTTIELTADDLVISDGKKPLSLAGVMGGFDSAITLQTKCVVLESAHFDAAIVRAGATRHKLRTEASARFEKNLDQNQNVDALKRLAAVLASERVAGDFTLPIISLGALYKPAVVTVSHADLERKLGVAIPSAFVQSCLKKLDFVVHEKDGVYQVTPPAYRGSKSITIAEDIIEEVARFWGFENIPPTMPLWVMEPKNQQQVYQLRAIKKHMAYGLCMHEVINYPFFDESLIGQLGYVPQQSAKAKNPLSQNMVQLVTSLVPHLCQNVSANVHRVDTVGFFECGRVWHLIDKDQVHEQAILASLWWDTALALDFYTAKSQIQTLFDELHMSVAWHKIGHALADRPWYSRYQTAVLMHQSEVLGYAGMMDVAFSQKIGAGVGFVCELDLQVLTQFQAPTVRYKPASKFPYVSYDISMLVPLKCTVEQLTTIIKSIDTRIYDVQERDIFEKEEWLDQRSVTMRFYVRDAQKTLSKQEADAVYAAVAAAVIAVGARIR